MQPIPAKRAWGGHMTKGSLTALGKQVLVSKRAEQEAAPTQLCQQRGGAVGQTAQSFKMAIADN